MNYVRKILENIKELNTFETIDMTVMACDRINKEIKKDKRRMLKRIKNKFHDNVNTRVFLDIVDEELNKLGGGK